MIHINLQTPNPAASQYDAYTTFLWGEPVKKPPDIADIVRTIIWSGDRIKPGTATKLCKVAVSPYFNRITGEN